ncbi:MAG: ATP-binding cassette domain-containing protein, partial [Gammaproteobacteria bacterium]|nr:ATP-binding cassette domain-containing protein [Gammaproteobacteria bacterium]
MKPDPVITATDIHKHFVQGEQDLHILRGIDLTVNQGERIAIVGLSGSGKSTLLHLLGGL